MVRLEIKERTTDKNMPCWFTFQYGQIRNSLSYLKHLKFEFGLHSSMVRLEIHLLLHTDEEEISLHSSMVRLEISFQPVSHVFFLCLHSSMVRLEMFWHFPQSASIPPFTFQYGQIRNSWYFVFTYSVFCVYIPVWLDQKLISTRSLLK